MATNSSAIQKKIETLKKGLNNKFITASQKEKIKAQVEKLESQSKALAPKKSTKTATSSSLTRLQKLVKNKKYSVYKGTGVDLKKDSDRPAKAIGKRTSKSGKTYYEYRANRIDVKQPPKEYPKLEKGGYMAKGGKVGGRGWEGATKGEKVKDIKDFVVGGVYLAYSPQFNAKNLIRITSLDKTKLNRPLVYASYVRKSPNEEDFVIWDYQLKYDEYYRAKEDTMSKGGKTKDDAYYENWKAPKEIYSGKDIKVTVPKMGDFEEYKVIFVYDKENFIFKMYDPTKKRVLVRMSGLDFENNLMNGSYIIDDYMPKTLPSIYRFNEYAKGGSLSSIKDEYDENEDNNAHSENVVLLAKHFGTKEDLTEAKRILALHEKEGSLSSDNGKKRQQLHLKLIEKARTEMAKDGIEFAKGGYMASGGMVFKKGDVVMLKDGGGRRLATIVEDGFDKENRVRIRPEGFPMDISVPMGEEYSDDKRVYVLHKMEKGGYMADGGVTEKEVVESNAEMVLSQIKAVKHHAEELSSVVSSKSNIEAWVVGKIERASTDLSDITHYLEGNKDKMSMGGTVRYYAHKMDKK